MNERRECTRCDGLGLVDVAVTRRMALQAGRPELQDQTWQECCPRCGGTCLEPRLVGLQGDLAEIDDPELGAPSMTRWQRDIDAERPL